MHWWGHSGGWLAYGWLVAAVMAWLWRLRHRCVWHVGMDTLGGAVCPGLWMEMVWLYTSWMPLSAWAARLPGVAAVCTSGIVLAVLAALHVRCLGAGTSRVRWYLLGWLALLAWQNSAVVFVCKASVPLAIRLWLSPQETDPAARALFDVVYELYAVVVVLSDCIMNTGVW